MLNQSAYFNEFILKLSLPIKVVNQALLEKGFIGGYDVSELVGVDHAVLLCATEKRTKKEIDQFVEALAEVAKR